MNTTTQNLTNNEEILRRSKILSTVIQISSKSYLVEILKNEFNLVLDKETFKEINPDSILEKLYLNLSDFEIELENLNLLDYKIKEKNEKIAKMINEEIEHFYTLIKEESNLISKNNILRDFIYFLNSSASAIIKLTEKTSKTFNSLKETLQHEIKQNVEAFLLYEDPDKFENSFIDFMTLSIKIGNKYFSYEYIQDKITDIYQD